MSSLPEAGDLRVPPLVRGQRRIDERYAQEESKQGKREERWGPPHHDLPTRTLALALAALAGALAIAVWIFGLGLTPDRYLLVLLVPALVIRRPRAYLVDFVPFALLLVLYSLSRGLAHIVNPHPFYRPQLRLEQLLFAGHFPTVFLQHALGVNGTAWSAVAVKITRLHFIVPPVLAFFLWLKRRALFYRFGASLLVLSFAAAVVFLLYPSAPPWAAADAGMLGPITHLTHAHQTVSAGASGLGSAAVGRLIPANPYAAIPSLHAGYAFLVFLFVAALAWRTRWRWPVTIGALTYPLVQSAAVIYTADHYVVDVLIGYAFAAAAYFGVSRFWRARSLPL